MRISSLLHRFSSEIASFASFALRLYVCAVASLIPSWSPFWTASMSRAFFTYCWVSVEPPWVAPPLALEAKARIMPLASTPPCS